MDKDIVAFVEGHGFGHASRMYKVLKDLSATIISFKDGAKFFKEKGFDVVEIREPYPLKFNDNGFDLFSSLIETLELFGMDTVKKIRNEINKASIVLVDSSLIGLIAAKAYKKKLIFITNNTDVSVFLKGSGGKLVGESVAKFLSFADKIAICDFPPPYTISLYNIRFLNNMEFIGPLNYIKDIKRGAKRFGIISGGANGKENLSPIFKSIQHMQLNYKVLNRYTDNGPLKKVNDVRHYYGKAKWIITHGGHSTIMEAILLGVPIIIIPQDHYAERYNNALMVEKLGLGVKLYEKFLTPLVLEKAIEDALSLDIKPFSRWANKFNGIKRLKEIVEEFY